MFITKTSLFTGKTHTLEVDVTEAQLAAWNNGALIQDVMPQVPAPLREFLINGVTPEEWAEAFPPELEEEEEDCASPG